MSNKMAESEKVLVAKPDNLSLIPGTHIREGENQFPLVLQPPHEYCAVPLTTLTQNGVYTHAYVCVCAHTQMCMHAHTYTHTSACVCMHTHTEAHRVIIGEEKRNQ